MRRRGGARSPRAATGRRDAARRPRRRGRAGAGARERSRRRRPRGRDGCARAAGGGSRRARPARPQAAPEALERRRRAAVEERRPVVGLEQVRADHARRALVQQVDGSAVATAPHRTARWRSRWDERLVGRLRKCEERCRQNEPGEARGASGSPGVLGLAPPTAAAAGPSGQPERNQLLLERARRGFGTSRRGSVLAAEERLPRAHVRDQGPPTRTDRAPGARTPWPPSPPGTRQTISYFGPEVARGRFARRLVGGLLEDHVHEARALGEAARTSSRRCPPRRRRGRWARRGPAGDRCAWSGPFAAAGEASASASAHRR